MERLFFCNEQYRYKGTKPKRLFHNRTPGDYKN